MFTTGIHMKHRKRLNRAALIADEAAVIQDTLEVAQYIDGNWQDIGLGAYSTNATGHLVDRRAQYDQAEYADGPDLGKPEALPDFATLDFATLAGRYERIWNIQMKTSAPENRWRRSRCVFVMRVLWNYAVNAIWYDNISHDEIFNDASRFCNINRLFAEPCGGAGSGLCQLVFEIADARAKLDDGLSNGELRPYGGYGFFAMMDRENDDKSLTLHDIALLAGMTDKSVRNATFMDGDNRLNVYGPQGMYRIKPEEASRWLSRRRGFKPTKFIQPS